MKKLILNMILLQLVVLVFGSVSVDLLAQAKDKTAKASNADKYEKDDTWQTAKLINVGETQNRSFSNHEDIDWVKITITKTEYYLIEAESVKGYDIDCAIELYSSDMVLLEENDNYIDETNDAQIYVRLTPGTYYLKVYTVSDMVTINPEAKNSYKLKLTIPEAVG